jgi:four helix bundle protein
VIVTFTGDDGTLKSRQLGIEGIHFANFVRCGLAEQDISRQILRSLTAPGALIAEAVDSESLADMHHKFGIALKECRESFYWIDILRVAKSMDDVSVQKVEQLLHEVTAMLVASRKTLKQRMK